jgi:branched-chain amino acid transport system ATP-binding protein
MGAYTRSDRQVRRDIEALMERFPMLGSKRRAPAGTLSGGQQQILEIAIALLLHPRLLLIDEPSLGLAPLVVKQIFAAFGEIRTRGVTFVLVEQNARQALGIADRAYVLETGEITRSGPATRMLGDETIKRAYLGGNVAV